MCLQDAWTPTSQLQTAGSYDQLNLEGLAALEIVARRVQFITEAYANPPQTQKPNWDTSTFFSGNSAAGDTVSLELKHCVLKKAKGAVDVENLRYRERGMKGTEHGVAPPQVTTRRKAAVVGGVGSSHDDVRNGVWVWPKRRQDYEQQPARGSTLGRTD